MADASTNPAVFQALIDASIEFSIYFAPQRGFDVTIADSAIGLRNYQPPPERSGRYRFGC
jgi:hypothetical protein